MSTINKVSNQRWIRKSVRIRKDLREHIEDEICRRRKSDRFASPSDRSFEAVLDDALRVYFKLPARDELTEGD